MQNDTSVYSQPGAVVGSTARSEFLMRVYSHVLGAVVGLITYEVILFQSGLAITLARAIAGVNWLIPLGAFMLMSWLATRFAHKSKGLGMQYLGLGLYVVAFGTLLSPMLVIAHLQFPGAIMNAAGLTILGFGILTWAVFWTRKDFSFLRPFLMFGGLVALAAIVGGAIFGYDMGLWFSLIMVVFAGGAILYDTSNILHNYPNERYVGAALQLFASVALMFWYILRIFLSRD